MDDNDAVEEEDDNDDNAGDDEEEEEQDEAEDKLPPSPPPTTSTSVVRIIVCKSVRSPLADRSVKMMTSRGRTVLSLRQAVGRMLTPPMPRACSSTTTT